MNRTEKYKQDRIQRLIVSLLRDKLYNAIEDSRRTSDYKINYHHIYTALTEVLSTYLSEEHNDKISLRGKIANPK